MENQLILFQEPQLEFRYSQTLSDPRNGLALFGPYDADAPSKPSLNYVVLGTEEGISEFEVWSKAMNRPSLMAPGNNHRLWPPYPGYEAAFAREWPQKPVWTYKIDRNTLLRASRKKDAHERAYEVVELFLEGFRRAKKLDENIGVAVCVVPETVWKNCRTLSRVTDPIDKGLSAKRKQERKVGQMEMFEPELDPLQYWHSPDFRRQLKARSMEFQIPLQIIRETTLRLSDMKTQDQRDLTPLSDRMWNLGAALYYKCGGKPWRLVSAREGVCYIGIAFRRADEGTACCAAQMFLNTGDGIVFLGEYGPWYSPKTNQFHLDKSAAAKLLDGVLKTYQELEGKELTEIFLHSRSTIDEDEFQGFQEACPPNVRLVGVRVRQEERWGTRLYRNGDMPIIRGSFWKLNEKSGFLWGSGFKPQLGTYDGWDVPRPLRIDVQYGDAPVERVAQDILGLTKLNYNACQLGDAEPVTVGFSDAVGEILISNPKVPVRSPNFKYYI